MDAAENLSMPEGSPSAFLHEPSDDPQTFGTDQGDEEPVLLKDVGKSRFSRAPAPHFLKNIFQLPEKVYKKKRQDEICMFSASEAPEGNGRSCPADRQTYP